MLPLEKSSGTFTTVPLLTLDRVHDRFSSDPQRDDASALTPAEDATARARRASRLYRDARPMRARAPEPPLAAPLFAGLPLARLLGMAESRDGKVARMLAHWWEGYGGGEEMPLAGYAAIVAAYGTAAAAVLAALAVSRSAIPERIDTRDVLLFGVAAHKLTRTVTKDWVTAPLRAPFTVYRKSVGAGEVSETSRESGVRRAVGDLLTCAYCAGPWVAGGLYATYLFNPRLARLFAAMFASVAISDWVNQAYDTAQTIRQARSATRKPTEKKKRPVDRVTAEEDKEPRT